jgi:hypothetical protein
MRRLLIPFFWIEVLSIGVLLGIAIRPFSIMLTTGNPEIVDSVTGEGKLLFGLLILSLGLKKSWQKILAVEPETVPTNRAKHKKYPLFAGSWVALCCAVAVTDGVRVGTCYNSDNSFQNGLHRLSSTMDSVRKARTETAQSGIATVGDWILVYKRLQPQIAEAEVDLQQLRTTIPTCGAYHSTGARFDKMLANLGKRLALMEQEIEVAKSIESLPSTEQQKRWQSDYVPLVTQEGVLEKEHN